MHPGEEMWARHPLPHCLCLASSSSLGSVVHTALQGSHGPGAETSVLLLQVKLRKPRAGVQRELKEKETEDLKQQIRTYSTLLRSVTHWAGEVKAYQKSDVYLSSVRVASKTLLSIASFDLAAVLRGGHVEIVTPTLQMRENRLKRRQWVLWLSLLQTRQVTKPGLKRKVSSSLCVIPRWNVVALL